MAEIHSSWQRDFDVYDRLNALGIDLGTKADAISDPRGRRICNLTFTPSGLVFASGTGAGTGPVTNDDQDVEDGYQAGREAGISHILSLHWGLEPFGELERCLVLCQVYRDGQLTRRRVFLKIAPSCGWLHEGFSRCLWRTAIRIG